MGLFGLLRTSHGPLRASAGLYRPQPALTGHMGPQRASHGHLRATTGLFGYTGLSWANAGLNWPLMDLYGPLRASHGLLMGHFGPHGPSTGLSRAYAGHKGHKAISWASIGLYVLLPGLYRPMWGRGRRSPAPSGDLFGWPHCFGRWLEPSTLGFLVSLLRASYFVLRPRLKSFPFFVMFSCRKKKKKN